MFWANTRPRPEAATDLGEILPLIARTFRSLRAPVGPSCAGVGAVTAAAGATGAFGRRAGSPEAATGDHPGPSEASTSPKAATRPTHNPSAASARPRTALPAPQPSRCDRTGRPLTPGAMSCRRYDFKDRGVAQW